MAGNDVSISVRVHDKIGGGFKAIGAGLVDLVGGAIVPAVAAVGALGVEFAGAGAALGVFGAAVAPQVSKLKEVNTAQDAYNKAVTDYGKNSTQASTALKKYHGELASLNPAQKAAFTSFSSLKSAFSDWSDSLSGDTLPVFTHGMNGLRNVLPLLTPLVKAVSKELLGLTMRFEAFSKTDKFKSLVASFSSFAAGALHNVITGAEKLARVIAGWVTSAGFQNFIQLGVREGPGLAKMFQQLAQFIGRFVAAAGPLGGLQLKVLEIMASALNAIPMGVLKVLVPTILGIVAAIRLWTIAQAIWNGVMAISDALAAANPFVLLGIGIAALVAGIIYLATKTRFFQTVWAAVWGFVKNVFNSVVSFLRSGSGKIVAFLGPIGAVLWIAANWGKVKTAIGNAIGAIVGFIKGLIGWVKRIVGKTIAFHQKGAEAIINIAKSVIGWVRKVVGKVIKLNQQGASAVIRMAQNIINIVKRTVGKTITLAQRGASGVINLVSRIISTIRRFVGKTVSVGVRGAAGAVAAVSRVINAIRHFVGKTVNVGVNFVKSGIGKIGKLLGFAHGGIVGAAAGGGPRSNQVMVGEQGPEIVDLPTGSRVRSNADSRAMMGRGGAMSPFVITIKLGDNKIADLLIDPMRKSVQNRGGVQAAFGKL